MPSLRTLVSFVFGLFLLTAPAAATWSIVIIDLVTGEIAIGIATCLTGFDLRPNTVVVVPGYGVAAAQSFVGPLSLRELIRNGFLSGTSAQQILAQLAAADPGHQSRQYGIASLAGGVVTFTGTGAGAWAGGLTGQTGSLVYAVQGNVLTGQPVVTAAELAIVNTPGTIGDKLMAAMEAARSFGGDGRCSCSPSTPTACGSPPPSFTKSAHIGLMIVSRPNDLDLPCNGAGGCGSGQYWMDLNVANQLASAPDPVIQLQALYNTWKLQQVGRPDHFQSSISLSANTLRANGSDTLTGTVVLRDAQGNPLGNSLPLTVGLRATSTATGVTFGPVTALPNGSYTFDMHAGLDAGQAVLDVAVTDGFGRIGLAPNPVVQLTDLFGACGAGGVPNGTGGVADVLRIDGSAGTDRVAAVGYGQPFTISLDAPPAAAPGFPVGLFALWAHAGVPVAGPTVPLGGTNGALCFLPAPFAPAPTALLADSFGLGGAVAAPGTPWSLAVPGVPALLDVALQGVMIVDANATFAATNAVLLHLVPLPAPAITTITPTAATPGANVVVQGTNFLAGLLLQIAGNAVPIQTQTPTQLTFTMPPNVACDAQLTVTNLGGLQAQRNVNPTPVITGTPFASGSAAGGALYIVTGLNLTGTTVTFNGVPMTISTQNATAIVGTTPPGTAGPAQVIVRNPNGCQAITSYTYL